jgi:hypothetical protein
MSGGHFRYINRFFDEVAEEIERLVRDNDLPAVDGDPYRYNPDEPRGFGFSPEVLVRFREAAATCRRAAVMANRVDYLVSADDGEDNFMQRWDHDLAALEANQPNDEEVTR